MMGPTRIWILFSIGGLLAQAQQPIGSAYFGIHLSPAIYAGKQPWPSIPFGTVRLLGYGVSWADIEPAPGKFDFHILDMILAKGRAENKTDFLNSLVKTPPWASSNTSDPRCAGFDREPGGCYPPKDLNDDGSGADQLWKDYVTAVVKHVCVPGPCKIQSWEVWNEPNAPNYWKGTIPQLIRLARDAYQIVKQIDPNAIVVSPPPAGAADPTSTAAAWLASYLKAGGGQWADVIGFHGYLKPRHVPSAEMIADGVKALAANAGGKPLWDTEGSWLKSYNLPEPDLQASYVARYYLLQATEVQRFYWFSYEYGNGTLYDAASNRLNSAGVAYGQVYEWMVGATPDGPCTKNGSIYTCAYTRPGGYNAMAVWDASGRTSSYPAPAGFTRYRDLTGKTNQIQGGVPIDIKPVWIENRSGLN
jgi:hypothetical protein